MDPRRIGEPGVRADASPPLDARLASLALRQHGVFALDQLAALGLSPRATQQRAATGRLHRIHRGVYALVPLPLLAREGRWLAAVLACGPGAALSHRSATALLGIRASDAVLIDVTVPGSAHRRRSGIRVHRSLTLRSADVAEVDGVPCTTVARTLLDLAEVVNRRGVERAFDQAEIERLLDLRAVDEQLARNPTRRGAAVVRQVLAEHYIGETATWSETEEAFLALSRRLGLPPPRTNHFIDPHDGEPAIRVDFAWPAQRVAVEVDGFGTHGTRQAFERDRRRDQRLTAARWRPIRTTSRQIIHRAGELAPTLLAVIGPHALAAAPANSSSPV